MNNSNYSLQWALLCSCQQRIAYDVLLPVPPSLSGASNSSLSSYRQTSINNFLLSVDLATALPILSSTSLIKYSGPQTEVWGTLPLTFCHFSINLKIKHLFLLLVSCPLLVSNHDRYLPFPIWQLCFLISSYKEFLKD